MRDVAAQVLAKTKKGYLALRGRADSRLSSTRLTIWAGGEPPGTWNR